MLGRVHRFWQTLGARCGAAFVVGLVSIPFAAAHAQNYTTLDVTNVNSGATANRIARNIARSIEQLPGLVSSGAYLMGIALGVLGIIKIKDHVENPSQAKLKDGAIRLAAGGALFALPIIYEAMLNTIGTTTQNIEPPVLHGADFNVRD